MPSILSRIKNRSPEPVASALNLAEFFAVQRFSGFQVPDRPSFDPASQDVFADALASCRSYLEFGSGGSTLLVSRLGKPFVSVESDPYFANAVRARLRPEQRDRVLAVDIGLTGPWGTPLFRADTPGRLALWRQYPHAPWALLRREPVKPDLVLVDGRFRVACALLSLKNLGDDRGLRLLVDDYAGREHYRAVEDFAELAAMHGRMAEFRPRSVDAGALDRAIERFERDWR